MTSLSPTPSIAIEPNPGNPGYTAHIVGGDPKTDPSGSGDTRMAAALDLARELIGISEAHPAVCLAIAAVLRAELDLRQVGGGFYGEMYRLGFRHAIETVEVIW